MGSITDSASHTETRKLNTAQNPTLNFQTVASKVKAVRAKSEHENDDSRFQNYGA
jgi:hypothetical protein